MYSTYSLFLVLEQIIELAIINIKELRYLNWKLDIVWWHVKISYLCTYPKSLSWALIILHYYLDLIGLD